MLPKILFIADEIPQSIHAGSIQFLRLFENYPPDRLLVIGKRKENGATTLNCSYYELVYPLLERLRLSRFSSILSNLQALGFFLPVLPQNLEKIAKSFKPDIVISIMQLITYYYPAYHFAKRNNIPLLLFCHDDAESMARVGGFFRKRLIKINSMIYNFSSARLCISPEMATAWEEKYGTKGDYQYPIASPNISPRTLTECLTLKRGKSITIGYAGSLAYGYKEGIIEILPVLEATNTVLKIYRSKDIEIPPSNHISFEGYAATPEETWKKIKQDCDAVILPYSREKRFEQLYSTHFPSKLPEYLSLQMPIIVTGPTYASGMLFAERYKNAFVSGSSLEDLQGVIELLISSPDKRISLSKGSASVLNATFTTDTFFSTINKIAQS